MRPQLICKGLGEIGQLVRNWHVWKHSMLQYMLC